MPSHAPTYRWFCHRCRVENEPGLDRCAACEFPAIASSREIGFVRHGSEPVPIVGGIVAGELGWWAALLAILGLR